jgi:hypothetical protein
MEVGICYDPNSLLATVYCFGDNSLPTEHREVLKYIYMYLEYHSVCLLVKWDPPTQPLYRKRVCNPPPPPRTKKRGATLACG